MNERNGENATPVPQKTAYFEKMWRTWSREGLLFSRMKNLLWKKYGEYFYAFHIKKQTCLLWSVTNLFALLNLYTRFVSDEVIMKNKILVSKDTVVLRR